MYIWALVPATCCVHLSICWIRMLCKLYLNVLFKIENVKKEVVSDQYSHMSRFLEAYGTWHGKLNFFRGIPWLFRAERHGFSARVPRNFCAGAAELPRGWTRIFRADGHESSVRIRFENGGNQKANFVRNNAKRSRNTPQRSFEISL